MKNKNVTEKDKVLVFGITILSIIVITGVGFAFFSSPVTNTNNENVTAETASISLKFDDNDNGISGTLNLGESITKKFTLENTGTKDAYAKINWYNLVNTYTADSLTWTLEQSTSENGTYEALGSGKVPVSSSQTTAALKNGILVPVNTIYYYKLTITLNNLDVEQNSDINANFHSFFSLEEGSLTGAEKIQNLVAGEPTNTTDVITKTATSGANCTNTLAYDGTMDNNLRYVGSNPCNYVTFNGETAGWRIVGIMNNVDDGTGNLETRIKLIRATSLGNYSWDSSASGVNSGYGINDWTQADLKNELNEDYLDTTLTTNTMWYNGWKNQKTGVYYYTKGLTSSAQAQIGNTKWYLGGQESSVYSAAGEGTTAKFYGYERGNTVWGSIASQTCNDGYCPRSLDWTGKVALIYPSDYGYAVGGSVRNTCLGKNLNTYNSDSCYTNDWIYSSSTQWLLSPYCGAYHAFYVGSTGIVDGAYAHYNYSVRPAVYLKSSVTISGGNGTQSEPYVIG